MPKRVSKKNMRPAHSDGELVSPKANYYGSLAEYKESMTEEDGTIPDPQIGDAMFSNTMFSNQTNEPLFPPPQFIGRMGQQDAGYDDRANFAGYPARGAVGYQFAQNDPLVFRGIKNVHINPEFLTEKNYFKNDADSIYRQAANKTTRYDNITSDHQNLYNMYGGIVQGANALSRYFNKPFTVGKKADSPTVVSKNPANTLKINIGENVPGNNLMNATVGMYNPNTTTSADPKPYRASQNVNISQGGAPKSVYANVFMHEVGHNLGMAHTMGIDKAANKNSIMDYDSPTFENPSENTNSKLLPADINYYRDTMGYNLTPQSIVKRLDAMGRIATPREVTVDSGPTGIQPGPSKKNKKNNNRR